MWAALFGEIGMADWMQILTAVLLPLAPLFFLGGCPCCGGTNNCTGECTDVPPSEVTVTIAGVVNSACGTCATYNTTYIVTNNAATCCGCAYGDITTAFIGSCNTTSVDNVDVFIGNNGAGQTRVSVHLTIDGVFGDAFLWQSGNLGARPIACQSIGTINANYVSHTGTNRCASDGSAITVTL